MTAQQLKNSILQLAVQGKLVPQDLNDEPASVLLERIRAEKQRLIREGKIKKSKNESVIYRAPREGDDGAVDLTYGFFERLADGSVRDIMDELPFEIPENWELCRLEDIVRIRSSKRVYQNELTVAGIPFLRVSDLVNRIVYDSQTAERYIAEDLFQRLIAENQVPKIGDILVTSRGTLGLSYIVSKTDKFYFQDGMISWLDKSYGDIDSNYLAYLFGSEFLQQRIKQTSAGTAVQYLSLDSLKHKFIIIPPLAEQHRIVERIEELLPYISDYDVVEQKMTTLNATFPAQLRKSILQSAVQGKLVPQDEYDEPASMFLRRIWAEKEKLIQEGKIKRNKYDSVIIKRDNSYYESHGKIVRCIDDETPFDLPDNWAWARLGSLGAFIRGSGIKRSEVISEGVPCVRYGEIYTTYNISMKSTVSYVESRLAKQSKPIFYGDLLFTLTGENKEEIGKTVAFMGKEETVIGSDLAAFTMHKQNPLYLSYLMSSPYAIQQKAMLGTGDIIVHISSEKLSSILVPVPPIAEQHRIVLLIEQLLTAAEKL